MITIDNNPTVGSIPITYVDNDSPFLLYLF